MKTIHVTRYVCDFCRKGASRRNTILSHEKTCMKNPLRKCYLDGCGRVAMVLDDIERVIAHPKGFMESAREVTGNCLSCIWAIIVQGEFKDDPDETFGNTLVFDYRKELEAWYSRGADNSQEIPF